MYSNDELYEYVLDNIQKIVFPEELIRLKLSLSAFELLALMMSEKYQTVNMGSLAQGLSVPMSTATGIVNRLVKKGLVARGRNEEDRRVVTVSLTETGRQMMGDLKKLLYANIDRVRGILSADEFHKALELLHKLILAFQQDGQEQQGKTPQRRIIKIE